MATTAARTMNFGSGPGALPLPALQAAREEFLDVAGSGMSILEHSHRGAVYEAIHEEARALFREVLDLPASHDVLFFQGGASEQFATIPMNFLAPGQRAGYVVHGVWGEKAVQEATTWSALRGADTPAVVTSQVGTRYQRVASEEALAALPSGLRYVHCTTNETIHGVQWNAAHIPAALSATGAPIVCDMSSDFLSRPTDLAPYTAVYAGAQKNVGPSGLVVVIARTDFIESCQKDIPRIFRYDVSRKERSLVNTPAVFSVYLARNVLQWLKAEGGLEAMGKRNEAKAQRVYSALESSGGFYTIPVDPEARSQMNVVFGLPNAQVEMRFLAEAKARNMVGLQGHRSVGGMRAALYNAVPEAWSEALAEFLTDFAKRAG
jgi:phosphoserine aminotransferase